MWDGWIRPFLSGGKRIYHIQAGQPKDKIHFTTWPWLENLHVLAATLYFDVDVSHRPLPLVAPFFVTGSSTI